MISTDNVTHEVCAQEDVNLEPLFELIGKIRILQNERLRVANSEISALQALTRAVFIVPLTGIVVNFAKVMAYMITPRLVLLNYLAIGLILD